MDSAFREIRLHRAKSPQEFLCDLLYREKNYVVIRYISPHPAKITTFRLKKGSITIDHYWEDKNYVLWKLLDPKDGLLGYLFHICKNMEVGEDYVRYEDLELDIWFDTSGNATVLDQDELDDYGHRGLFRPEEISCIMQIKDEVIADFLSIIRTIWKEED